MVDATWKWAPNGNNREQQLRVSVEAARLLCRRVAQLKEAGVERASYEASMAKLYAADVCMKAAEDAVLSANYIMASLKDVMTPAFEGPCMHEALFDDGFLKDTGVSTLDFAKAMIDEGYHPMTMYFPLVVHGAMLIEPTESQAKEDLDLFIAALRALAERARSGSASMRT